LDIPRKNGKTWTKNEAIQKIVEELAEFQPTLRGDTVLLGKYPLLSVDMIPSNYSDKKELELNGSIVRSSDGKQAFVTDLFSECKAVFGEKYRGLHLWRDEAWEGSSLQKECQEVFIPVIRTLGDSSV
jgi:hypothetical protein